MEAETKYAKSGDVHIAYRVFGNGPRDIILVPGTVSHVELYWELPANEYLLKRLASFRLTTRCLQPFLPTLETSCGRRRGRSRARPPLIGGA